ncbi:MAG: hypothetical protein AVDCRST_MAG22-197, partial [uncultured Rubrobacteraceae bacterium]
EVRGGGMEARQQEGQEARPLPPEVHGEEGGQGFRPHARPLQRPRPGPRSGNRHPQYV